MKFLELFTFLRFELYVYSKSPLKNSVNVTKNPPLPKHFLKETTAVISKMLGKPSSNVS